MKWIYACLAFLVSSTAAQADRVLSLGEDETMQFAEAGKARFADVVFPDVALRQAWFAQHVLQHEFEVIALGQDRYGRVLVQSDATRQMLREGIAVLFPQAAVPADWVAAEDAARLAKRGVWGQKGFVLTPEETATELHHFHVVQGKVTRTYRSKNAYYLNFGEAWQTDFSVAISGRQRRAIEAKLGEVTPGTAIRVRGTLIHENGPMIRVTQPEQISRE